ncbi:hypothetical protein ACFL35_15670 [Candidatus Riflebacteria bacterium]
MVKEFPRFYLLFSAYFLFSLVIQGCNKSPDTKVSKKVKMYTSRAYDARGWENKHEILREGTKYVQTSADIHHLAYYARSDYKATIIKLGEEYLIKNKANPNNPALDQNKKVSKKIKMYTSRAYDARGWENKHEILKEGTKYVQSSADIHHLAYYARSDYKATIIKLGEEYLLINKKNPNNPALDQNKKVSKKIKMYTSRAYDTRGWENKHEILEEGTKYVQSSADIHHLAYYARSDYKAKIIKMGEKALLANKNGGRSTANNNDNQLKAAQQAMNTARAAYEKGLVDSTDSATHKKLLNDYRTKKAAYEALLQ